LIRKLLRAGPILAISLASLICLHNKDASATVANKGTPTITATDHDIGNQNANAEVTILVESVAPLIADIGNKETATSAPTAAFTVILSSPTIAYVSAGSGPMITGNLFGTNYNSVNIDVGEASSNHYQDMLDLRRQRGFDFGGLRS